jgi:glucose dehydrogenase
MVSRGVAFWQDPQRAQGTCTARIFLATLDARLIALDAADGRPCREFGEAGTIDLLRGVEGVVDPWEYNVTSPPAIAGDRVIVGASIVDIIRRIQPSGAVRAFDARSGRLAWRFDTIPRDQQPGVETWEGGSWRRTAGPTYGRRSPWTRRVGGLFCPSAAPAPITTGAIGPAPTIRPRWWLSMRTRAGASGTSRPCITTYGTTTSRRRRCC